MKAKEWNGGDKVLNIKETARKLIAGSVIVSESGVKLFTPDGMGNYKALWTRDFAYMVTQCCDLFEEKEIEEAIQYLIDGARECDGWIPDRVDATGKAFYHAGGEKFPGDDNLDNAPFLILAAAKLLLNIAPERAKTLYSQWKKALVRGMECLPVDENGILVNDSEPLHSPYGFTDTICKGGKLCMETLLYWEALCDLAKLEKAFGTEEAVFAEKSRSIERVFADIFTDETGMLLSCTGQCRHIDLWASCYAIFNGFPLKEMQKTAISAYMVSLYDEVVSFGQLRHLPAGEYWEETFEPYPQGEYQNGAFWATPAAWLCATLALTDVAKAKQAVTELLAYFESCGVYECVNGEYRKLDTYVASATSAYAAAELLKTI